MNKKKVIILVVIVIAVLSVSLICFGIFHDRFEDSEKAMKPNGSSISKDKDNKKPSDNLTEACDATLPEDSPQKPSSGKDSTKAPVKTTAPTTAKPTTTARQAVRVTIPEGYTLTQIFKKIEAAGVCSFDSLMQTAETYDYSYYTLIANRPNNVRTFKLEGYLFPSTYEFYKGQKPQDVIGKFLRNGKNKVTDAQIQRAAQIGRSIDEVLIVASIIEKEGSKPSEVANVAAVIYNRLKAGQKLQMDSSIVYIESRVKPFITGDVNRYNALYNTYKCPALPAGPISNPGMKTINAALYPADVPYLFFCHDANANYYYATTYEEHQANLKLAGLK